MSGTRTYETIAAAIRSAPAGGWRDDRELIRLATLAASSHNTQPWRFRTSPDAITIVPDRARRCPVVDPDDAHLYRSLGCAAENLVHAATTQGLLATPRYVEEDDAVVVTLAAADLAPTDLSRALVTRQCTRAAFDGSPVADEDLARLQHAGTGDGIRCVLLTADHELAAVAQLVERGNLAQLADDAFRGELLRWVRFNPRAATRTRDGLAGRVNRQPPLPTPLGALLAPVVVRASAQARVDRERLGSSAGVALFLATADTRAAWVEVGRAYERFALRADLLDIRTAFVNQPVEVPTLRGELEALVDGDGRAQLLVRFGHGPRAPYSLRRAVDEVLDR
jgi:hypothetical protein